MQVKLKTIPKLLEHKMYFETDASNTAHAIRNVGVHALSTVSLIAFIEGCAGWSVVPYLDEGEVTVGTVVDVRHVAPAAAGTRVRVESILTRVENRKLMFETRAFDGERVLMEGRHGRVVFQPD